MFSEVKESKSAETEVAVRENIEKDAFNEIKDKNSENISFKEAEKIFENLFYEDFKETIVPEKQETFEAAASEKNLETETANEIEETVENPGLTEEEKQELRETTGWSDNVIDYISSMEEAQIYIDADLKETEINGKAVLMRDDIDWEQKDEYGRTNKERVSEGLVPINKNGENLELHHIGQKTYSPLAELTSAEHRQNGNSSILHDTSKRVSEIDRNDFGVERKEHWQERVKEYELGGN